MNTNKAQCCLAIPNKMIRSNEVHVWCTFLDLPVFQTQKMFTNLSTDEIVRARRFHFQRDQNRFVVARGVLRQILSYYLEDNPGKLRFEYTANGKPMLVDDSCYDTIAFNLSHCGSFALYAITRCRDRDVGIDIERVRRDVAIEEIAHRFFAPGEINALKTIPENKQYEAFFQYWTRKEAILKAKGEGLSFPIEQVDVSLMNGDILAPVTLYGNEGERRQLYVKDLFLPNDYVGAVAVDRNDYNFFHYQYSV